MSARALILLRARLAAQRDGARLPIASLFMQAFASGVLCLMAPSDLTPFAYAFFALCVCALLVAIPLLGELGDLLVRDEADAWVRGLPLRESDVKLARALHLAVVLAILTLGASLPAALLAHGFDWVQRSSLVAAALGQSCVLAAAVVLLLGLFSARAPAVLVALQTALFVCAIVGGVLALRHLGSLRDWSGFEGRAIESLPPAWFAVGFAEPSASGWAGLAAPIAIAFALAILAFAPPAKLPSAGKGAPLLSKVLAPARALARRIWLRPEERGPFELVFDGLPKEREFVLRGYPLIGLPLAFLWLGARGESGEGTRALLSLLLFTPAVYLPVLIAHLPISASHRARWILDGAPIPREVIRVAALKALMVRFVLPLYLALGALAWSYCGAAFALGLTPLAFLATLMVVRQLADGFGIEPPMSVPPESIAVEQSWFNAMGMIALLSTLVAVFAVGLLDRPWWLALAYAVLILFEVKAERQRRAAR